MDFQNTQSSTPQKQQLNTPQMTPTGGALNSQQSVISVSSSPYNCSSGLGTEIYTPGGSSQQSQSFQNPATMGPESLGNSSSKYVVFGQQRETGEGGVRVSGTPLKGGGGRKTPHSQVVRGDEGSEKQDDDIQIVVDKGVNSGRRGGVRSQRLDSLISAGSELGVEDTRLFKTRENERRRRAAQKSSADKLRELVPALHDAKGRKAGEGTVMQKSGEYIEELLAEVKSLQQQNSALKEKLKKTYDEHFKVFLLNANRHMRCLGMAQKYLEGKGVILEANDAKWNELVPVVPQLYQEKLRIRGWPHLMRLARLQGYGNGNEVMRMQNPNVGFIPISGLAQMGRRTGGPIQSGEGDGGSVQGGKVTGGPMQGLQMVSGAVQGGQRVGESVQVGQRVGEPVQGGQRVGESVQVGQRVGEPVQGGQRVGESVQGGQRVGESVQVGQRVGEPVQGGQRVGEPVQVGQRVGEPVQGGQRVGDPVQGGQRVGLALQGGQGICVPMQGVQMVSGPVQRGQGVGGPTQGGQRFGPPQAGQSVSGTIQGLRHVGPQQLVFTTGTPGQPFAKILPAAGMRVHPQRFANAQGQLRISSASGVSFFSMKQQMQGLRINPSVGRGPCLLKLADGSFKKIVADGAPIGGGRLGGAIVEGRDGNSGRFSLVSLEEERRGAQVEDVGPSQSLIGLADIKTEPMDEDDREGMGVGLLDIKREVGDGEVVGVGESMDEENVGGQGGDQLTTIKNAEYVDGRGGGQLITIKNEVVDEDEEEDVTGEGGDSLTTIKNEVVDEEEDVTGEGDESLTTIKNELMDDQDNENEQFSENQRLNCTGIEHLIPQVPGSTSGASVVPCPSSGASVVPGPSSRISFVPGFSLTSIGEYVQSDSEEEEPTSFNIPVENGPGHNVTMDANRVFGEMTPNELGNGATQRRPEPDREYTVMQLELEQRWDTHDKLFRDHPLFKNDYIWKGFHDKPGTQEKMTEIAKRVWLEVVEEREERDRKLEEERKRLKVEEEAKKKSRGGNRGGGRKRGGGGGRRRGGGGGSKRGGGGMKMGFDGKLI